MFSMSLKSVPGTLVLIAPRVIGVPVALTPGLVPQADVASAGAALDDAADAEAAGAELLAAGVLDDAGGEEVVELELHAARTPSDSAATAAAAVRALQWKDLFMSSAF
jgi:hypothetical protein